MPRSAQPAATPLQDPLGALRLILPSEAAAGGGPIALLQRPLPAAERAVLARARGARIADFTAGRSAARDALADCGVAQAVLPQSKSGPPVWPAGFAGSISHARGWALAVCAPTTACRSLGLDIETCDVDLDLAMIASPTEAAQAADHLPARLFSAKEAAYKALFPLTARMLGFEDMSVTFGPDRHSYSREAGSVRITPFTARLVAPAPPFAAGYAVTGAQVLALDLVISLVVLPADCPAPVQGPRWGTRPRTTLERLGAAGLQRLWERWQGLWGRGPLR